MLSDTIHACKCPLPPAQLDVPPRVPRGPHARQRGCNRNAAGGAGGGFGGGGPIPPLACQGSCAASLLQEACEPSLSSLHHQQQQPSPHRAQHYTHPALLHRSPPSHGSQQSGPDEAAHEGEAEAQCPDPLAPAPGGVSPVRGACVEGGAPALARSRSTSVAVVHMSLDLDARQQRQRRQRRQLQLVRDGAGGVSMSGLAADAGALGEGRGLGGEEDGIASGRDSRVGPVSPCQPDPGEDGLASRFALLGGRRGSESQPGVMGGPGTYVGGVGPPCPPATGPGPTTPDAPGASAAQLMQLQGAERARPGFRRPVHAHRQLRAPHPALDAVQQTGGALARHQPCAAGVTLSVPAPPAAMDEAAAARRSCPQLPTAEPMPSLRRGVYAAAAAVACSPPPLCSLKPQQGGRAARLYGGGEGDPGGRHLQSGSTRHDSLFMQSVMQRGASIGGLWDNVPGVGVGAAAGS